MKKNFFKKLAFVLALALVVTSIAPAAATTAAAAKAPAWSNVTSSKKTIYVGKKFDINIKNKPSAKSTYKWTSSKTSVATVNSKGVVTAKKVGTTTITCVIKNAKTGKTTKTLKATVTVKENATAVAISNPVAEVAVGEKVYDFNRTLTKKSATDKTYWVLTDNTAGATVDSQGVVSTTKVGEFKIQAVTATSRANFEAGKVTAKSDVLTVKVPVAVTGVKQTAYNKVAVTFNTNVKELVKAADFKLENVATHADQAIKAVTFSTDGTVATLETYLSLVDAKEYTLTYAEKSTSLTASVGAVASVVLNTTTAVFGEATEISYSLLDANGVDVTGVSDKTKVTVDVDTTNGYVDSDNKLTLFAKGDTAKVTVTYHTYKYENNAEITYKAEGVITAVDANDVTVGNYDKYTVAKTAPDWTKLTETNTKVAVGDTEYSIYVKATDSANNAVSSSAITFASSNDNVLLVDATTGALTPVKEGTAYIIASVGNKASWTLPVTVVAERKATSLAIKDSVNTVSVSNTDQTDHTQTVEVVVKDQYGEAFSVGTVDAYAVNVSSSAKAPRAEVDGAKVTFHGENATKGSFTYVIEAQGKKINFGVTVLEPNASATSVYKLELSQTTVDTVITKDTVLADKDVTVKVAEYKGGVFYDYADAQTVKVTKPDNTTENIATGSAIKFATVDNSGAVVKKAATGTYKVVATVVDGTTKTLTSYFKVVDTQVAPTVSVDKLTSTLGTDVAVANDVLTVKNAAGTKLDVTKVTSKVVGAVDANNLVSGSKLYIEKVTVTDTIGTYSVSYEISVGRTITIK